MNKSIISTRLLPHLPLPLHYSMALESYAYLVLSTDVLLLISFPLQLRLLTILLYRNRHFIGQESDFYRCLTQIIIVDFTSALFTILAVEPATYGAIRKIYENNAAWISKVVIFQVSSLCILGIYFHLLIALNRLTAMLFTMHFTLIYRQSIIEIWTPQFLRCLHMSGWFLCFFLSLPLICPIRGSYVVVKSPFGQRGLSFLLITSEANIAYQVPPVLISTAMEVTILIVYFIILINARKYTDMTSIVIRTTAASVLMCFISHTPHSRPNLPIEGGWFLILFTGTVSYYGHALNDDLFSLEVFYGLFKIGYAINGSITSWIVVFLFRDIRSRVLFCFSRSPSNQIQLQSLSKSNSSTTRSNESRSLTS